MVKTKNGLLMVPEFSVAFTKLMKLNMPIKSCLALSTAYEEVDTQVKIINRSKMAILEKYCIKDENGKPVPDKSGNASFESEEIQKKCMDDISSIMSEDFELHLENKIPLSGDGDVKMSPEEFMLLKDFIEVL